MRPLTLALFGSASLGLAWPTAWAQEESVGAPEDVVEEGDAELPIIVAPGVVEFIEAEYPEEARAQKLEATVVLTVELDAEGKLVSVEVTGPAGHGFDEAALAAVRAMQFTPAQTEAGPVPVLFELPYNFAFTPDPEPVPEDVPPPVNLEGTVIEMGTRNPVPRARVLVDGTDLVAITDENGRFELAGVPVGTVTVRALEPGHVSVDARIEIAEGEAVEWRFWMRATSYRENEAVAVYQVEQEEVTRRTLSIEEVKRIPGTFGDPIKVIQSLPGAARSPFGTGALIIRGANPEDSGVYVDGVRIPLIYHLTGFTSVFSPEIIQSVDYLPGGYGPQYGRTSAGVIDVTTKREFKDGLLVWGTDVLDSQLYYEGNIGKNKQHGLAIGARRSYIDAFIPLFVSDDFTIKPRYWDYQAKWIPKLPDDKFFSVFFYGFDDVLEVATPDDVSQGSDQDTQGDLSTQYASQRVVLQYGQPIGDHVRFEITPSIGVDYSDLGLGDEFGLATTNVIGGLRAELDWQPTPWLSIVPGLDTIGGSYEFDFKSPFTFDSADDPLAERESVSVDGRGFALSADAYIKAQLRPLRQRERWIITPGLRYSNVTYTYAGTLFDPDAQAPSWHQDAWDPRIGTRFAVTDRFLVKAATGMYTQPPQPFESIGFGTDVDLVYEHAFNTSVGWEHRMSQAIHYEVEVFYRDMQDLVVFNPDFQDYGDQNWINQGQGRAYGAEVILRHDRVKHFFGWISYTLSRADRKDAPDQDWYPFDFDQTHILSAQGGYDLPWDFEISAQIQFVTGNPTSTYNAGIYDFDYDSYNPFQIGTRNDERLPDFFQTSVRLDKLWTFRRVQLDTYLELLNAIRGVNPEFTLYEYDYSDSAYIRGLPFIPNIGIELRFSP